MVDMEYELVLQGITANAPENLTGVHRRIADAVVTYLTQQGGRLRVDFQIALDAKSFELAYTAEDAGLWEICAEGLGNALAERTGVSTSGLNELRRSGTRIFKGLLEKVRDKDG